MVQYAYVKKNYQNAEKPLKEHYTEPGEEKMKIRDS